MAKIKQGILGGFSGKVANVVGTSWKGRAVMKSQPLSVSNPRTESQQEQRGKFSDIAKLASSILTQFVQPVENPISGNVSGYNLFCKDNKSAFSALGVIQDANFVCGGGKLENLPTLYSNVAEGDSSFNVSWTNPAGMSAIRLTDKVYMAAFNENGELVGVTSGTTTRNAQSVSIEVINEDAMPESMEYLYVIYACVSADGRDVTVKTTAKKFQVAEP